MSCLNQKTVTTTFRIKAWYKSTKWKQSIL